MGLVEGWDVGAFEGYAVGAGVLSHLCFSSESWLTCFESVAYPVGHSQMYSLPSSLVQDAAASESCQQ